ncbi:MAG: hypothetical protein B6U75_02665 [Desulfurococcales archaeon ex4484_217_1]|nr:MAG: hypothetical protein B6U75_02665 [Desulfurococcales archaeon ex4484_217_1]
MINKVREIFAKEQSSKKHKIMADILRVLCLTYGRLWLSEIVGEVNAFRRTLGERGELRFDEALRSVEELERMGIVSSEKRVRSSFVLESGVPDILVNLNNRGLVLTVVFLDEKYIRYIKLREEAFKELRE